MTPTEKIISFGVGQVLGKIFGGPTSIVVNYHKIHFILLARALSESNRDSQIQETLASLKKNLDEFNKKGHELVTMIPDNPEMPSNDLTFLIDPKVAKDFQARIDGFIAGAKSVVSILQDYADKCEDIMVKTELKLKEIEKNIASTDSKLAGLRALSNHNRTFDIFTIRQYEMSALKKQCGYAKDLLRQYKKVLGQK